eukprot:TRINITY_DN965_c0_g1::TRINITY_DN965_c0_g1_i1::g.16142::m.16142 TRINITY_DN965_c0_g1::TRINITY_DN965_c0_g1_i1::g.16142  ORF type:complete len:511 (+),score=24.40,sp/Q38821/2ABA_ARATH/26.97/1e-39,WD40/PF00400.27/8.9e+02,WD40/PF00400.27/6e+03,WD40/PF00400.27/1.2e+04,WD40/PF00400.27/0.37,WD40/PF00400.27/1e+04 TRINITY_DN965_c0_g1_i1:241-1773(+)
MTSSQEQSNLTCNFTFSADFPAARADTSKKSGNYVISSLRFCETGENLAVADTSGRVLVLHRDSGLRADFYTCHAKSLACNKVVTRKEKAIRRMRWVPRRSAASVLLTTDGALIQQWKVKERKSWKLCETNADVWKEGLSVVLDSYGNGALNGFSQPPDASPKRQNGFVKSFSEMDGNELFSYLKKRGLASAENGTAQLLESADDTYSRSLTSIREKLDSLNLSLRIPKLTEEKSRVAVTGTTIFKAPINQGDIHSLAVGCDPDTYLSADKLTITLHNLEYPEKGFQILDLEKMSGDKGYDSTLWLTCAEMHPEHSSLVMYGDSAGVVKVADLRIAPDCSAAVKAFGEESALVIAAISSLNFGPRGSEQFVVRDYMDLRLYDIRKPRLPLQTFKVHEHIRRRFNEFCKNGHIYDEFDCGFSGNGSYLCTGSYHHSLRVFDKGTGINITAPTPLGPRETAVESNAPRPLKVLACHPTENMVAVADGRRLHLCDVGDLDDLTDGASSDATGP